MKVNISARGEYQLRHLLNMLAWMEWCGNVGHSSAFTVFFDGDGAAKIKLEFEDENTQKKYDELRKSMKDVEVKSNGYDCSFVID